MKVIKKILKVMGIMFLVLVLAVAAVDAYMVFGPRFAASKEIPEIERYAMKVDGGLLDRDVKVIGLGEATHGNVEFQELKLDVLQVLVRSIGVSSFCLEMDYGEGTLINDYINGYGDMDIDELMDNVVFPIYHTEQFRELIEWMREHNSQSPDAKLSFYGFDLQNPEGSLKVIRRFLTENRILEGSGITDSFEPLINGEIRVRDEETELIYADLEKIRDELESNSGSYSGLRNYDRVLFCISNLFKTKELAAAYIDPVAGGAMRDREMAGNVIAIYEEQQRPIMIAGHNGHVGYAGSYVKTMGHYLRETFGADYFVIGTDYFTATVNIGVKNGRERHSFCSADILAYQAKRLGTYYIRFSDVEEDSPVYPYLHEPIYTGSVGESFTILNLFIPGSVRIYCNVDMFYDAMILVYQASPTEIEQ